MLLWIFFKLIEERLSKKKFNEDDFQEVYEIRYQCYFFLLEELLIFQYYCYCVVWFGSNGIEIRGRIVVDFQNLLIKYSRCQLW